MNLDFCPNKASKEFREMKDVFGEDTAYFLDAQRRKPLRKGPKWGRF